MFPADIWWSVYTLTDPRTNEVRYVGWTMNLTRRFREHLAEPKRYRTHKSNWIRTVLADGLVPILTVIETGKGEGWAAAERKWIAAYRAQGCNLTNATDGGNGALGRVIDTETRRKISATKKSRGIPPESLARMTAAHRGKKQSPERIKKAADARRGWRQTPEAREKISAFNRGKKQSPEHTAKAIASRKAKGGWKVTPEHIEKMATKLRGRKRTPEAIKKSADGLRGKSQCCGICREPGHKRATCPQRAKE
jgi:hypothetical protein